MTCSEFDLIRRFFTEQSIHRADVPLGIGDDAALLAPPPGKLLAVSMDTLIAGVHFPVDQLDKICQRIGLVKPSFFFHKNLVS